MDSDWTYKRRYWDNCLQETCFDDYCLANLTMVSMSKLLVTHIELQTRTFDEIIHSGNAQLRDLSSNMVNHKLVISFQQKN